MTLSTADSARRIDDHESVDGIGDEVGIGGGWQRKRQGASSDAGSRDDGRSIRGGSGRRGKLEGGSDHVAKNTDDTNYTSIRRGR